MNVFLPLHAADQHLALDWVKWAAELGGNPNHALFLHPARNVKDFEEIKVIAEKSWKSVEIVKDYEGATGWPAGPNACMRQAAQFFWVRGEQGKKEPWLFCEPDAIPLVPDWLDQIENGYRNARRPSPPDGKLRQIPFMGAKVVPVGDTPPHMSGVAVYPWDAIGMTKGLTISGTSITGTELAFDISAASDILPLMHATKLIQHVLAGPDSTPPTFPDQAALSLIQPEAVLFHRNKDGSLIARLREKKQGRQVESQEAHNLPSKDSEGSIPSPATRFVQPASSTEPELEKAHQKLVGTPIKIDPRTMGFDPTPENCEAYRYHGKDAIGGFMNEEEMKAVDAKISLSTKNLPTTIAGQLRALCEAQKLIVGDNIGRRVALHAELRRAGLLGKAKKKGKRK